MKKSVLLVLLVGIFMIGVVSAADCDDNQTIMRLYQENNSHVALWNESVSTYLIEICYDDIFGNLYTGDFATAHDCAADGSNRILSLYSVNNSHASTVDDDPNYPEDVCYGNLVCEYEVEPVWNDSCANGGKVVARMYSGTNTHVSTAADVNYLTKICCNTGGEMYWTDSDGKKITKEDEVNIGDTVLAVATGVSEGVFHIWEYSGGNKLIRDIDGGLISGKWTGEWTITQDDLKLAGGLESIDRFIFKVGDGEDSYEINVSGAYNDAPMNITIVEPFCGEIFDEGDEVRIVVDATNPDDHFWGNITVDGAVVKTFESGDVINFTHKFDSPETHQIVAEAYSIREGVISRSRHIANIIVLEMDGGAYVNRKYVAACIFEPKDFTDIEESNIHFNASTTVGVEVNSSGTHTIWPDDFPNNVNSRFEWYWWFMPDNVPGPNDYDFYADFPAGDNSASLSVTFD